jgi:hypothetical protein
VGSNPAEAMDFLRMIKIHDMPSFGGEVQPMAPCCKILQLVRNHLGSLNRNTLHGQIHHFLGPFLVLAAR